MGKEEAFVAKIKENEAVIFKITSVYTDTVQDRQDLYQEIVFQLWKAFDSFRGEARFSTWMYRVALNTAIKFLERGKRRPDSGPLEGLTQKQLQSADPEFEERIALLYTHIRRLNALEKAIILLYLEGKKYGEIAEISGLTESNVGTRLGRIRAKLKDSIPK